MYRRGGYAAPEPAPALCAPGSLPATVGRPGPRRRARTARLSNRRRARRREPCAQAPTGGPDRSARARHPGSSGGPPRAGSVTRATAPAVLGARAGYRTRASSESRSQSALTHSAGVGEAESPGLSTPDGVERRPLPCGPDAGPTTLRLAAEGPSGAPALAVRRLRAWPGGARGEPRLSEDSDLIALGLGCRPSRRALTRIGSRLSGSLSHH